MVAFATEALTAVGVEPAPCSGPEGLPALFSAAAAAADPRIGLRAGALVSYRATNPVIYLMMSSPTLADAFAGLRRFAVVLLDRPSRLEVGRGHTLGWSGRDSEAWSEFVGAALLGLCQWVVGRPVHPVAVHLKHARPAKTGAYREVFGSEPVFGAGQNALVLSERDWKAPSAHTNPDLYALHREFLELQERRLNDEQLVAQVREAIAVRLGVRPASLDDIAGLLALSPRAPWFTRLPPGQWCSLCAWLSMKRKRSGPRCRVWLR